MRNRNPYNRLLLCARSLLLATLLGFTFGAKNNYAEQEPAVTITFPSQGSSVGKEVVVRGTATLPQGQHLWLFARRIDFAPLWWPQREVSIDYGKHTWQGTAVFGIPQDVGWDFEIAAIT